MPRVLALDISTVTGWCVDAPDGNRPLFGHFEIHHRGDDIEAAYVQGERMLVDLIRVHQPEVGAFEAPLPRGSKNFHMKEDSAKVARKLLGLAAVYGMVLRRAGLVVKECTVAQARASLCRGDADKDQVMQMCRMYGWSPKTLDESDAGAVWVHWKRKLDRDWDRWFCQQSLKAVPLFAEARG